MVERFREEALVSELNLSVHVERVLVRHGVATVGQLRAADLRALGIGAKIHRKAITKALSVWDAQSARALLPRRLGDLWETFLPISSSRRVDAPPLSASWLAALGFAPEAPLVLRILRDHVLPLVHRLEEERVISWYSVLLHDRASGVPTDPEDGGAYVHLRFLTVKAGPLSMDALPDGWLWTRRVEGGIPQIAGIDGVSAEWMFDLLGAQSAWYLRLVAAQHGLPEAQALANIRQYLHFFANIAQVEVA